MSHQSKCQFREPDVVSALMQTSKTAINAYARTFRKPVVTCEPHSLGHPLVPSRLLAMTAVIISGYHVEWHHLPNATCLMRPPLLYASFVVSRTTIRSSIVYSIADIPIYYSTIRTTISIQYCPLLKKACVRQVVLDKWISPIMMITIILMIIIIIS